MRVFRTIVLGGLAVYLLFLAVIYSLMIQPPARFAAAMAKMPGPLFLVLPFETLWSRARAGAVHLGDQGPEFRLPTLDRKSEVSLASFRGAKPVVLIFGSYT